VLPKLPPAVEQFLRLPNPSVIACIRPDGFPMSVATWYEWSDGLILVNMHEKRDRLRWMRVNPRVSVTVLGEDWSKHVSMFGSIVRFEDDTTLADIDRLCVRYSGRPFPRRTAKRVSAWIEPMGWLGWDETGELASHPPV